MDLGRFNRRLKNFREFLGQVLEGERELLDPEARVVHEEIDFNRNDDINRVSRDLTTLASNGRANVGTAFAALAPYFELGFNLRRAGGRFEIEAMFLYGRVFTPPGARRPTATFGLARETIEGVIRGRVAPVLQEARLDNLAKSLAEGDAVAFEPVNGRVFLLVSDRPHPWQVGMVESVYLGVREALTPRSPIKPAPLRKFFR